MTFKILLLDVTLKKFINITFATETLAMCSSIVYELNDKNLNTYAQQNAFRLILFMKNLLKKFTIELGW